MSLYNMIMGCDMASFLVFPMLGFGHPENFPRFRDCHIEGEFIEVLSRMGGGNRDCWEKGEENCDCCACMADKIEKNPLCISRTDDDFDCTYCTFKFKVPEEWKKDFELIKNGNLKETSEKYKNLVLSIVKTEELKEKLKKILFDLKEVENKLKESEKK